ncbi:high mobility group B protein 15 [Cornus florida]|uniref:high mobility group B protein 15 n=1 Tax=Cornus florida TaxID=4283 RepID=UPI0028A165E2|nr:high mobility group B protein 15 [Cornus florida]
MVETEGGGGGGGAAAAAKSGMASSSAANQSPLTMREAPSNYQPYQAPMAKYEDVVASPKLFMTTLEKLHAAMGTKFMIPIIGGKDLDLHRLFVEVTSRGGIEKTVRERRWKEVTNVFSFPSTATNASFVLRKYYISLLHHYEQIYFFKAKGWTPVSADALQSPSVAPVPAHGSGEPMLQLPDTQTGGTHQTPESLPGDSYMGKPFSNALPPFKVADTPAGPVPLTGSPVIGVIDGKFESGYLVTVTIGSEKLKGVLYQALQNPALEVPQHQNVSANDTENKTASSGVLRRRRRKKSEMRKRDPAHPKPNRSGYNFFFAEQHARLKPLHPGKDREISRMIGELWTKMEESEKVVYQDKAMKDKERYKIEMEDYRERLRLEQFISDAIPIQQRPPESDVNMVEANVRTEIVGEHSPHSLENEISSDKSDMEDDKTADENLDMETSPGAEIGVENVAMDILTDKEAFELREKVDKVGDKIEENLDDVLMETENEPVSRTEKESVDGNDKESVPSEYREN